MSDQKCSICGNVHTDPLSRVYDKPAIPEPGREEIAEAIKRLSEWYDEGIAINANEHPYWPEIDGDALREKDIVTAIHRIRDLEGEVERLEGEIHTCPTCGSNCVECECVHKDIAALREANQRLRQAVEELIETYDLIDKTYGVYMPDGLLRKKYNDARASALAAKGGKS